MLIKFNIKSEYAKNIVTLVTGTAIAQVIPIVIMPMLTRLYTPVEFGMFGMYIGIVSLLLVISTFKLYALFLHAQILQYCHQISRHYSFSHLYRTPYLI